jgi:hypothetical protein
LILKLFFLFITLDLASGSTEKGYESGSFDFTLSHSKFIYSLNLALGDHSFLSDFLVERDDPERRAEPLGLNAGLPDL